ncbi:MAG: ABC transporter permease [Anaerolineales bacterium]|nr:ABC transporter permease [Anaerolineales bacterium]
MSGNEHHQGFWAVVLREMTQIRAHSRYALAMIVLPLVSFALTWGLFSNQYPQDLPVAVVDLDHSSLSRTVIKAIDATSVIAVSFQAPDPAQARDLMLRGKIYAMVILPHGLEEDILRGRGGEVIGYTNTQMLLPGSIISSSLSAAVATVSAGINFQSRLQRGEMNEAAMAHLEPVILDRHVLFNPQLNYMYFLAAALCPTFFQIFILITAVMAMGSEFKNSTAGKWLETAGGSVWKAVTGKLAVYFISFNLLGLAMLVIILNGFGVPLRGSLASLVTATVLLVLAYLGCGIILVFFNPSLRMALSSASFFSGTAFAFVGLTFPQEGMPALGKAWSNFLPLTHYLHIFLDQTMRSSKLSESLTDFWVLLIFAMVGIGLVPLLKSHMKDSRYWGKP